MGKVRVLPDDVANRVAAGEVVERPASIVKELAENSLDAGATRITIEYARGGSRLVSVRDDGCGMSRDDAVLSLERHATSKLRSADDLATVTTMGFRGEALPSIASVSRFRLLTREPGAAAGTEILSEGGRIVSVAEAGPPTGTLVEARDLFFNIPARRKFLRGEETESAQIFQAVQGLALSAPSVAIECRRDGRAQATLPAAPSLEVRLRDLFGAAFVARLVGLPAADADGFRISGFVGKPGEGRRDRLHQHVILNGRPVTAPEISAALREACAGTLPAGTHPLAILHIEMDTALVDCNVHPAKKQVRFARPEDVRRVIFDAVRSVLEAGRPATFPAAAQAARDAQPVGGRTAFSRPPRPDTLFAPPADPRPQSPPARSEPHAPELTDHAPPATSATRSPESHDQSPPPAGPQPTPGQEENPGAHRGPEADFRMLGSVGRFLFAMEGPEGLVLMDTRSARERISFERLLRQIEAGEAPVQRLLLPEVIELPAREHAWIAENLDPLREAGFLIEPFGGLTLKVDGIPAAAGSSPTAGILHEVATSLRDAGRLPRGHGMRELLARTVCRFSPGDSSLSPEAAAALLGQLLRCELPYAGPLGHPTLIQFSHAELERKFGR